MFPVCLFFGNQVEKYCLKINFLPKKKGKMFTMFKLSAYKKWIKQGKPYPISMGGGPQRPTRVGGVAGDACFWNNNDVILTIKNHINVLEEFLQTKINHFCNSRQKVRWAAY